MLENTVKNFVDPGHSNAENNESAIFSAAP